MMPTPLAPRPKRPLRWRILLSVWFWVVVAVVVAGVLASVLLATVPAGPKPFSVHLENSGCGCGTVETNHSLPGRATVRMTLALRYTYSGPAEFNLVVVAPSGTIVVYAPAQYGNLGNASVSARFTTTGGGAYAFQVVGAYPLILPPLVAWVNGTYDAPVL